MHTTVHFAGELILLVVCPCSHCMLDYSRFKCHQDAHNGDVDLQEGGDADPLGRDGLDTRSFWLTPESCCRSITCEDVLRLAIRPV